MLVYISFVSLLSFISLLIFLANLNPFLVEFFFFFSLWCCPDFHIGVYVPKD